MKTVIQVLCKGDHLSLRKAISYDNHLVNYHLELVRGKKQGRSRSRIKARTTCTLACTAIGVLSTLASMMAPYSVNTHGSLRRPPRPVFDIAICDIKAANSSAVS